MSYDPAAVGPRAVNPIEEGLFTLLAEELTIAEDKKEETRKALKEDLLANLRKEVKKLNEDAWMYAAPRSNIP